MNLDDFTTPILTLAEVESLRRKGPISKGPSRLELAMEAQKLTVIDEKAFRAAVIKRDGLICRCCGRKVIRTLARVPERLEVHHVHGRRGDLKFEEKAAMVLCLKCHEKVTGRVNEKVGIIGTKTFMFGQRELIDAREPVLFKRVA